MKPLEGRIALVAGATRGAGRGIAMMLGEKGATVYCSGRSVRGKPATGTRTETIEETAELVTARGGRGIAIRTDHTVESEVAELFTRVKREHGRLDVLVNDVWGGDELAEFGLPFWKLAPEKGRLMLDRGIYSHILTSRYAVPLMLERNQGLVVEITDGDNFCYRGNIFYDLVKLSVIRLAYTMAWELRRHPITAVAVTPGFLRSEAMLDHFGVTEATWRDGAKKDPHFIASETPFYVGRAVAALAADPNVAARNGRVFSSWQLAREYGFKDEDGSQPDWGRYFETTFGRPYTVADEAAYATWANGPMEIVAPDWPKE
ncbi:SDR family oxidoreductase [Hyalangium versicolor]|uniref:SDR family oxidoreductase n=1 Tax=Hyalangium versicolor TaxID=2861190 RepID=UPI001CCCC31D|nr:SDR family oxidoreductase [Hyalangium versicolor]